MDPLPGIAPEEPPDFYRCSGRLVCSSCGKQYRDHPDDPREPYLTVLCNGERVKL